MKQFKSLFQAILVILWFYGVSILGSYIVSILSHDPADFIMKHNCLINFMCYMIIFIGLFLVDAQRKQFLKVFKVTRHSLKNIISYILMGIGSYILGIIIIASLIRFFPDYSEIDQMFTAYEPILNFIVIVVIAPITEEYLFRHKIQLILKEGFNETTAILGQAFFFGFLHYFMLQKIYAAVLGVIFGFIKERKGIQATIWMHMTVNFIGWYMGVFLR